MLMSKYRKFIMCITTFILALSPIYGTEEKILFKNILDELKEDRWREVVESIEYEEYVEVDCELTFYTSLAVCNSAENVGKNAIGGYLTETSIAIPRNSMPFGTKVEIDGYGVRYADDVGHKDYIKIKEDGTYRFDIFIPRLDGESDETYHKRIMNMGRVRTTAKIYLYGEDE